MTIVTINRNSCAIYRIAAFSMTLNDDDIFNDIQHRAASVTAELVVNGMVWYGMVGFNVPLDTL